MKKTFRAASLSVLMLTAAGASALAQAAPETPQQHDARMGWWRDARFGMFIHFGLYSSVGGGWHGKTTPSAGEWIQDTLKIPADEYSRELLPAFNPVKFDAKQWVQIAKDAGMKYIVITSKHHDGFALFDSKYGDFNVMQTPFKRDIMKELADAAHAEGIEICWYHSIMDWHQPLAHGEDFPKYRDQIMRPQLKELLTNYGKIGVLWFDGEWIKEWTEEQGRDLYAELREIQPDIIINNRISKARAGMEGVNKYQGAGDYSTPEQQVPKKGPAGDWETCMTMNGTWGYKVDDTNWKSTETLIRTLVDVASKGGNFLLNVGPTGEGEIPAASVQRLKEIGQWLRVNGESVYGTTRSPLEEDPAWGKVTQKGNTFYLHVYQWPADGKLVIKGLPGAAKSAKLLATGEALTVEEGDGVVTVGVPGKGPDEVDSVIAVVGG